MATGHVCGHDSHSASTERQQAQSQLVVLTHNHLNKRSVGLGMKRGGGVIGRCRQGFIWGGRTINSSDWKKQQTGYRRGDKAEEWNSIYSILTSHLFQVMNQPSGGMRCNPRTDDCDLSVFLSYVKEGLSFFNVLRSLTISRASGPSCSVSTAGKHAPKRPHKRQILNVSSANCAQTVMFHKGSNMLSTFIVVVVNSLRGLGS